MINKNESPYLNEYQLFDTCSLSICFDVKMKDSDRQQELGFIRF